MGFSARIRTSKNIQFQVYEIEMIYKKNFLVIRWVFCTIPIFLRLVFLYELLRGEPLIQIKSKIK